METFEDAKIGDRVWNICNGWGMVKGIGSGEHPLSVEFDNGVRETFMVNGKGWHSDINPVLFWSEIHFDIPPKPGKLVTKVINGWVDQHFNSFVDTQNWFYFFQDSKPGNRIPATLTFEIEE